MPALRKPFASPRALAAAILSASLLLGGCADPGGIAPTARLVRPQALGLQPAREAFPSAQWWRAWRDPELDSLVARALAGNPDLEVAGARLEQAEAAAQAAHSDLLPHAGAGLSSTREQFSRQYIYPPPFGGNWFSDNEARLNASWELDFFGRNRQALDAAIGSAHAAAAQEQAARVLLAGNVVDAYVDLARLIALDQVQQRMLRQRQRMYRLVRERVHAGLDTTVQQRQAHAGIPQIRQRRDELRLRIDQARDRIAALLGEGPGATAHLRARLSALPDMPLPEAIPADLVGRRADVVAARWRVQAALHGVKAARAAFYPDIDLGAFVGFQALGFSRFLSTGSQVAGVGPALSLPIFEGGALRANLRGQAARADQAIAEYNATLVHAVQQAADAIAARRSMVAQAQEQRAALRDALDAHRLVEQRYQAGLGNELDVLSADARVLQLEQADVNLKAQSLVDDVALIRALGGGFDAAKPPLAADAALAR